MDGRNPEPFDRWIIPLFKGFLSQGAAGFLPSTVCHGMASAFSRHAAIALKLSPDSIQALYNPGIIPHAETQLKDFDELIEPILRLLLILVAHARRPCRA